ncbi:TetR family transcriptional regulator [Enterobacteriaceae bacterium A-F18]|nr:TetR/AcrR family transcriptional regulator [Phytobacter diazotrophicus]MDU7132365.1 TetR/AcrR family transcriptional regulator [Enterobacteriaceae bacterium]QIH63282.1 TetR family transcriptional regulator [Enterobacteriaceae bacterium A-F18]
MVRRTRAEMEETRATLLATGRQFFKEYGYAETSMDDLTLQAGLTRGALYYHFGDKKGLLAAVVEQIDNEMDQRLQAISSTATDPWEGFCNRCRACLEMALEPEYQRIMLRDAKAVLGGFSPESQRHCVQSMQSLIRDLIEQGIIEEADPQGLASLIYGSLAEAAFWIADGDESDKRLAQGIAALNLLLRGLRPAG